MIHDFGAFCTYGFVMVDDIIQGLAPVLSTTTVFYKTAFLADNGGSTKPPEGQ